MPPWLQGLILQGQAQLLHTGFERSEVIDNTLPSHCPQDLLDHEIKFYGEIEGVLTANFITQDKHVQRVYIFDLSRMLNVLG